MKFNIGDKQIGDGCPVFIIAEMSANHKQDKDIALKTIIAAKKAGADAIKIQTYTPDTMTLKCNNEFFKIKHGTIWDGRTFYELYEEAYTPWEWHEELQKAAVNEGMIFFSTPFDYTAVDFLEKLNVPAYKIASFELLDIPLIQYIASKGKPIIMSTGIAYKSEIYDAVQTCRKLDNDKIALLKCTSTYPAPLNEANLLTIPDMKNYFQVVVGLSDHSLGDTVALGAVALGAKIVEKHFILDRNLGGPDASFSMEPDEFKMMVKKIRDLESALGTVTYELSEKVKKSRELGRSLFAAKDIKKGEIATMENIRSVRPAYGLAPKYLPLILGKRALQDIPFGSPIKKEYFEE